MQTDRELKWNFQCGSFLFENRKLLWSSRGHIHTSLQCTAYGKSTSVSKNLLCGFFSFFCFHSFSLCLNKPISNFSYGWIGSALKLSRCQLIPIVSLQLIRFFVSLSRCIVATAIEFHLVWCVNEIFRLLQSNNKKTERFPIYPECIRHNKWHTTSYKQLLIIAIVRSPIFHYFIGKQFRNSV